nr:RecName: Full=66 kDa cell wall protein [Daucus carota]
GPLNAQHQS